MAIGLHFTLEKKLWLLEAEHIFRNVKAVNGKLACLYQHFPQSPLTSVSPLNNFESFIQPPRLFQSPYYYTI